MLPLTTTTTSDSTLPPSPHLPSRKDDDDHNHSHDRVEGGGSSQPHTQQQQSNLVNSNHIMSSAFATNGGGGSGAKSILSSSSSTTSTTTSDYFPTNHTTVSASTTIVRDNRSRHHRSNHNSNHQDDSRATTMTTESLGNRSLLPPSSQSQSPLHSTKPPSTTTTTTTPKLPSFFASTKPKSIVHHSTTTTPPIIVSSTWISQQRFQNQIIPPSPKEDPFRPYNNNYYYSDDDGREGGDGSIVPSSSSSIQIKRRDQNMEDPNITTSCHHPNKEEVEVDNNERADTNLDTPHVEESVVTAATTTASHRYSFFADQSLIMEESAFLQNADRDNIRDDDDNDETLSRFQDAQTVAIVATTTTAIPQETVSLDNHHHYPSVDWEEEATPEQTQFAKMLLFRRDQVVRRRYNNENEDLDNMSTASEHGSLIHHRMDENDDPSPLSNDENDIHAKNDVDTVNNSSSTYYQTPPQVENDDIDDDEHDEINKDEKQIPTDTNINDDIATISKVKHKDEMAAAVTATATTVIAPEENDDDNMNDTSVPTSTRTTAAVTNDFQSFSNAIQQRFSTTTSAANNTSQQNAMKVSQSAPTTPRASTTWYHPKTSHSRTMDNNNRTTANSNVHPINVERKLPSSFLLRSPGSVAFQSVSGRSTNHGYRRMMGTRKDNDDDDDDKPTKSPIASWLGGGGGSSTAIPKKVMEVNDDDEMSTPDTNQNITKNDHHNDKKKNHADLFRRPKAATNAFHLVARSCFSFDAYDTSMDDHYDIPHNENSLIYSSTTGGTVTTASTSIDDGNIYNNNNNNIHQRHLPIPALDHPTLHPLTKPTSRPSVDIRSSESSSIFKRSIPDIGYSASWDVSSTTSTYSPTKTARNYPSRQYNNTATVGRPSQSDYRHMFRPNTNLHRWGTTTAGVKPINQRPSLSTSSSLSSPKRSAPMYDDDYKLHDPNQNNDDFTQQLKSPQRMEIERNDAIDILACLVERGVSWKQPPLEPQKLNSAQPELMKRDEDQEIEPQPATYDTDDDVPSPADIVAVVEELQGLSLAEENLSDYNSKNTVAHQKRKLALEELVRSHEYAMEMKRASQSASSWLKSIGRSQSTSPTKTMTVVVESPARNVILSESITPTSNSPNNSREDNLGIEATMRRDKSHQAAGEDSSASDSIDILTLKAMLHSSQIEAKEKSNLADRLNEELAKCRAEIGRLKSSAQSMSFRSPNRSILDESDDAGDDDDDGVNNEVDNDKQKKDPVKIYDTDRIILDDNDCLDSSFLREEDAVENDKVDTHKLERYKAALNEANIIIRQLHLNLQKFGNEYGESTVPFVTLPDHLNEGATDVYYNDQSTATENFTTDWADLDPPLPNPPDHELESPIVAAVLDLWTSDSALRKSLLDWIDQVLRGADFDSVPPLTLSNLDHQARDGFVLHLLPLLLRRPDVLVDVKARANRRTTYDLAVSVSPSAITGAAPQLHEQPTKETISERSKFGLDDINSSAVTAHITNTGLSSISSQMEEYSDYGTPRSMMDKIPAMSRLSYDEMAEDIALSETSQPGLFSSLGGALGGLLLPRNRKVATASTTTTTTDRNSGGSSSNNNNSELSYLTVPLLSRRSIMNGTNMPTIMESPKTTISDTQQSDDVVRFVELDYDTNELHNVVGTNAADSSSSYHRVVSAPSGRIGVTFVDYRGHCMVSDVNHDSPLIGWIFPSDVLIAIDHIPVSGMPIRDIIKLLKERDQNTQRALRVISSHAMNELTLNVNAK